MLSRILSDVSTFACLIGAALCGTDPTKARTTAAAFASWTTARLNRLFPTKPAPKPVAALAGPTYWDGAMTRPVPVCDKCGGHAMLRMVSKAGALCPDCQAAVVIARKPAVKPAVKPAAFAPPPLPAAPTMYVKVGKRYHPTTATVDAGETLYVKVGRRYQLAS